MLFSTTYDQRAVKAFADALCGMTGNDVKVVVRDGPPCTDGKTVFLPSGGIWKKADYQSLCGVACHEVAHVWFGSHAFRETLMEKYADEDKQRAALCSNALLDVADESRFRQAFPRSTTLLEFAAQTCFAKASSANKIPPRPPRQAESCWQFLAVAVWLASSRPHSEVRRRLRGWRTKVPGVGKAFRILQRGIEKTPRAVFTPVRSAAQKQRLRRLTKELLDLLDEHIPRTDDKTDSEADAMKEWRDTVMQRIAGDAKQSEDQGLSASEHTWKGFGPILNDPSMNGLAGLLGRHASPIRYDESCYHKVFPAFRRAARLLATGPSLSFEHGWPYGGHLSRPHRASIDGRCFRRRVVDEGFGAAIAMLFDHSISMGSTLGKFLPVGVAMAEALQSVPNVDLAVWRFGTEVEKLAHVHDLKQVCLMGSTDTHMALQAILPWLIGQSAPRKIAVLFTDGQPDRPDLATQTAATLRRKGICLLVGSIGEGLEHCEQLFPGASFFTVDPSNAGSSLHVAIRRMRMTHKAS